VTSLPKIKDFSAKNRERKTQTVAIKFNHYNAFIFIFRLPSFDISQI